jgi:regulator of Ty1 transposition protein 109
MSTLNLGDLLAEVLPKDVKLNVRHVSTPPTRCEAIFSAPPSGSPETTFSESHFLVVTFNRGDRIDEEIAIFGIEILIYTTDRLTILFVSKADSTGNLQLLDVGPKTSLLRQISTTFLSYLVQTHQRPGVRSVLSLFARAQNQYLFPGSTDNAGKHVLDDRGLIRWWCRAVDPILRDHALESQRSDGKALLDETVESAKSSATAYLLVPGCDQYETRAFFPFTAKSDDKKHPRWQASYPLHQICKHPDAPPRCLVPRFPDDPKARFLIDLDDELPETTDAIASNPNGPGRWRSVKSLDQFWEMMAFRQECSAGRLVGFLWLVINPPGLLNSDELSHQTYGKQSSHDNESKPADRIVHALSSDMAPAITSAEAKNDIRSLSSLEERGPSNEASRNPQNTGGGFVWPEAGRGEVILSDADYKIANDVFLEQDFETEDVSLTGTMAWVRKVASLADILWWGLPVTGRKEISKETGNRSGQVSVLAAELIVRKRKKDTLETANEPNEDDSEADTSTKKQDHTDEISSAPQRQPETSEKSVTPEVNVLNASFIRKRKKT